MNIIAAPNKILRAHDTQTKKPPYNNTVIFNKNNKIISISPPMSASIHT